MLVPEAEVNLSTQAQAMLTSDFANSHKLFSPSMTPSGFNEAMTVYDAAIKGRSDTAEIDDEDKAEYGVFLEIENTMRSAAGVEPITSLADGYPLFLWYLLVPYFNVEPNGVKVQTHFDQAPTPIEVTPTPVAPELPAPSDASTRAPDSSLT